MKGLTPYHLEALVEQLGSVKGATLQKVQCSERDLVLGLWSSRGLVWLWMDLDPLVPFAALVNDLPGIPLKKQTPVLNFLKAHGLGLPLVEIELRREAGRVFELFFADGEKKLSIEIRLIARAPNVLIHSGAKKISWNKVRELSPFEWRSEPGFPLEDVTRQWFASRFEKHKESVSVEKIAQLFEKEKAKVQKSLRKATEDVERKRDPLWRQAGQWLKENQTLQVPSPFRSIIDPKIPLAANIERCFAKAKDNEARVEGAESRVQALRGELAALESQSAESWHRSRRQGPTAKPLRKEANIKARSLRLSDNDEVRAFFGKSGADNLKLLRQARAWDFWVHLKDEPGSHGLVLRPKGADLKLQQWSQVLDKLVETTLGERARERKGDKFTMIVCETRFVKPIKGDRLGRVSYQNERIMTLIFDPS